MLELELDDLGPKASSDGTAGLRVWWEVPPERKKPVLTVAWGDLVLIKPKLTWPQRVEPETEPGWKIKPLRIVYVPDMNRVMYQEVNRVPHVGPLYAVSPRATHRLTKEWRGAKLNGVSMARVVSTTQTSYLMSLRAILRVGKAIEVQPRDIELFLHPVGDSLVALAYRGGLRAVIPVVVQPE